MDRGDYLAEGQITPPGHHRRRQREAHPVGYMVPMFNVRRKVLPLPEPAPYYRFLAEQTENGDKP